MSIVRKNINNWNRLPFLFNDFIPYSEFESTKKLVQPAVNIQESDTSYYIELAAPGYEKNDFSISVEKNILVLEAKKEKTEEKTEENYTRKEFEVSDYKRNFTIPENTIDTDAILAEYKNGILYVTLPKKEEVTLKKVIKVA